MNMYSKAALIASAVLLPMLVFVAIDVRAQEMQEIKPSDLARPPESIPFRGDRAALVKLGRKLYDDTRLSTNGMACNSCHADFGAYGDTFKKPYPHFVQMVHEATGLDQVTAEQMVQFCMMRPMANKPLAWDSEELAALTAYVEEAQKEFAQR